MKNSRRLCDEATRHIPCTRSQACGSHQLLVRVARPGLDGPDRELGTGAPRLFGRSHDSSAARIAITVAAAAVYE